MSDGEPMKLAVLGTPHVGALLIAAGKTPQGARCRFQWYRGGCVAPQPQRRGS